MELFLLEHKKLWRKRIVKICVLLCFIYIVIFGSIEDVKGYNRALGILWCVYGVLFTLIGLPLLDGQNSGLIIIPILGAMLISIAAMVAYVVGIEPKYRKKK